MYRLFYESLITDILDVKSKRTRTYIIFCAKVFFTSIYHITATYVRKLLIYIAINAYVHLIMWKNVTLKNVIATVKLSLFITCCWPLPANTIKFKVICVKLYQYLCMILTLGITVGLCNTIRNHLDDPLIMAQSIMIMCSTIHVIFNIVSCKINSYRLQVIK